MVHVMRILAHPPVKGLRKEGDGNEKKRQPRKKERSDVLAEAANRHRPTGIEQVMGHHQEQSAAAETQKEHEPEQPRERELLLPLPSSDNQTEHEEDHARGHELHGHVSPFGKVQRLAS